MFQSFDEINDPSLGKSRIAALRAELARRQIDGFLVPLADEHQGEYIPACAARLRWLTGFGGSAGLCIVLKDKAAIFVDGRYTLQVREQVDTEVIEPHHLIEEPPHLWLKGEVKAGARIGFDPWLTTVTEVERFKKHLADVGAEFVPTTGNPVDVLWTDRPAPPKGAVALFPEEVAGKSAAAKIAEVNAALKATGADHTVLTRPDSIAWLFNIRGADVTHIPQALSFAILSAAGRPNLFIDSAKLSNAIRDHLEQALDVRTPGEFLTTLSALTGKVAIEKSAAAFAIAEAIGQGKADLVEGADPVVLPKARKNPAELSATRSAHLRDGAAMVRFLAWFDREAPKGQLTEIDAAKALEGFRQETGSLKDISFDTISGAGPNAAIPHYRVNTQSNRPIRMDEIFLIDSGAQYEDGTTDITRTMIVGTPTAEMKDRFTRVLKGHIRLSLARFPKGTTGAHLDILARQPLWEAGLDFDHGTGHGVGVYLSVHEGPARIAKTGHTPLEPGMLLSNEPGFYKAGAWGIRIENLVIVTEPQEIAGGERPMLGFETVTWCPIDRRLIDGALLAADERAWLNAYHADVRAKLAPLLEDSSDLAWLEAATAAI
ncbi:aminopeptidase P family protein [Oryzibacter oryziterrae]|uniref:aminopeptidase P family protein n=1 Tax=Oryzibacter oryziterrae TaxID=2766474 RepID=UPI001F3D0535|nr:aminopeptidase P family protein [Oryzibacter oryziterrae]